MKRSIAFLTLAAMAMTLGGCGGSSEPAEKKAEASKKKGGKGKPHENPWAIQTQGAGAEAAKPAAKPAKKKKGKDGETSNPWAKDNPSPPAED
ncbi:MAG: hypothetical protein C0515_04450 [Novosphingobium sp.]|nr:hypothetical protein [Novosphingobium sp.]